MRKCNFIYRKVPLSKDFQDDIKLNTRFDLRVDRFRDEQDDYKLGST